MRRIDEGASADRQRLRAPLLRRRPAGGWRTLGLPAAGGAIGAMSCPPVDVPPAILPALLLLALSLRSAPSWRAAALRGFVWALVGDGIAFHFVVSTVERFTSLGWAAGAAGLVVLAAFQALGWAACGAVTQLAARRAGVPFGAAFAIGVLVACVAPGVFVWTPAGLLAGTPLLVQPAELVGERGVSVVLALVCGLAAGALATRRWRPALAAAVLLGVLAAFGAIRLAQLDDDGPRLRVALVDQAAPARTSPDALPAEQAVRRLRALSAQGERRGADLVVWPEAAFPIPLDRATREIVGGSLNPLTPAARVPRLIGLQTSASAVRGGFRRTVRTYNSAVVVHPGGALGRPYDKQKLIWFGETLPLGRQLPFLRHVFSNVSDTTPGRDARALEIARPARLGAGPPVKLGILICYEDMSPGVGRRTAAERPQLLVNMTNDAWFAGTSAPELQARLARIRAVELRTPMVRAVNGGASGWVDAAGRLRGQARGAGPQVTMAAPALRAANASPTLYARVGDWPLWLLAGLTVAAGALARRRRNGEGRP